MPHIMIETVRLPIVDRERIERRALWAARDHGVLVEYLDRREAAGDRRTGLDFVMASDPEREAERLRSSRPWVDRVSG